MRVLHAVNVNCLNTYTSATNVQINVGQLVADDFVNWHKTIPKNLREICLQVISTNWTGAYNMYDICVE